MPAPVSGLTFLLKIENSGSPGTYRTLGGQITTALNRQTSEADATTKDSAGWHEGQPVIREATVDAEAMLLEGDAAWGDLETAWMNNTQPKAQIVTPAGHTYTGTVTVTKIDITGPHDNLCKYTTALKYSGVLTKV